MKLEIKNQHIAVTERQPLVSGTVNVYTAEFSFDAAWDGYTPVAVFESSGGGDKVSREAVIADGKCTVPWETLRPNSYLRIGVYGVSGDRRLPTIYADSLFVARGAESADEAAEPTPGVVEQIVSQVAEDRAAAEAAADRAEDAAIRQPYPNTETGTWWVWDAESGEYKDAGIAYSGAVPAMTATTLGGAMADPAQEDDTQPVRIGADNKLYTAPSVSLDDTLAKQGQAADAKVVGDKFNALPKVCTWATRELFDKADLVDPGNRNSILVIDGVEYYRYHASGQNFEWYNPAPLPGSVTLTYRLVAQYGSYTTRLIVYYEDGTTTIINPANGETGTYTTAAGKAFIKLTGNYDAENWILMDLSVMRATAQYDRGLPLADATEVGGVKADPAEEGDTQPVRIGADNKLYTAPGGGGGWELIDDITLTDDGGGASTLLITRNYKGEDFEYRQCMICLSGTVIDGWPSGACQYIYLYENKEAFGNHAVTVLSRIPYGAGGTTYETTVEMSIFGNLARTIACGGPADTSSIIIRGETSIDTFRSIQLSCFGNSQWVVAPYSAGGRIIIYGRK